MPVYTFTNFDDPLATDHFTNATGINASGDIVGFYEASAVNHGFLLSRGTYTTIDDPLGTKGTFAQSINDMGQIVGSYRDSASTNHGFLLSGGTYTTIDDPLATTATNAIGLNNKGQIVGEYLNATGIHGFLLSGGVYTTLDDPLTNAQSRNTQAFDINNAGQIVGFYQDSHGAQHGFLFSGGTYTTIDDPLGVKGTTATGINDAGQIVGSYFDSANQRHGFLLSGGFFTTIDDPAGTTTTMRDINAAGQIVGTSGDASGGHGFVETTVPNPPAPAGTSADMVLRGSNTSAIAGQYEIYDIGSNTILAGYSLGQVGTDWGFVTLGGFNGGDTSDMLLRNGRTGGFEVYYQPAETLTHARMLCVRASVPYPIGRPDVFAMAVSVVAGGSMSQRLRVLV